MSMWTYVNGVITVSPAGRTQAEKTYILQTIIDHLPKVTGSEGDMDIYIVQKKGCNCSSNCNEFDEYVGDFQVQDSYMLILEGSLRDRLYEQTFKELNTFLNRLAERLRVKDILVKLKDYDKEYIFKDYKPYFEMYEEPSWSNENGNIAWWEYLMWDSSPNYALPLKLSAKYAEDEDDADRQEFIRRYRYEFSE